MPYRPKPNSVVREFMCWLFDVPYGEPYISVSADIAWENAADWLDRQNRREGPRISTHHLFTAAVARVFVEFPQINCRVHQGRIYPLDSVDIVMPVNLLGTGVDRELGMLLVKRVHELDPRGVAAKLRRSVDAERQGAPEDSFVKTLIDVGSRSPVALRFALRTVAALAHQPRTADLLRRQFPLSTLITNVGASLGAAPGARFRAVSFSPPEKLVHVGSLFGLAPIERSPVVDGDTVRVGTVLPFVFVFDHRLVDGVLAGRILVRLNEILQDPAAVWGD